MARQRRAFTWEFKVEAVRLARESGKPVTQVARELGIRADLLREWRRQVAARGASPAATATAITPVASADEELRRLRRELEVTRQERDFLKKAAAFFAKESR